MRIEVKGSVGQLVLGDVMVRCRHACGPHRWGRRRARRWMAWRGLRATRWR
jgi:hypothetical protein